MGLWNGRTWHDAHKGDPQNKEGRLEEERSHTEDSVQKSGEASQDEIPTLGNREEERKGPDGVEAKRLKVEGCCFLVL